MPADPTRMARLRPEHQSLFPMVPAGRWLPASEIGRLVLTALIDETSTMPPMGTRLLDDRFFEFDGGWSRGTASRLRTRHEDDDAIRATG